MSTTLDTGGPAFPFPVLHGSKAPAGMSLRDYFAAHAPEVPPWFTWAALPQGLNITDALRLQPGYSALTLADLERLRESEHEGDLELVDLPDHLKPIAAAANQAARDSWAARSAAEESRKAKRFFEWRWYYADQVRLGLPLQPFHLKPVPSAVQLILSAFPCL